MHCGGEGGHGEGCGGEGGGRQGGWVGHIGAGIILSASYLLGFDPCSISCLKLKVEVEQSQNTVLLASTQATIKGTAQYSASSITFGFQPEAVSKSTCVIVGSLRA